MKQEAMNLKKKKRSKEEYMEGIGERKGKGKLCNYVILAKIKRSKQQKWHRSVKK